MTSVPESPAKANSSNPVTGSPETELLCLCARTTVDPLARSRTLGLVGRDIDWDAVITLAQRHHVLPLVYQTLRRIAPDNVPQPAMRRLQGMFRANARRNLFLTGELFQVMSLLRAHDIASVPYKGPAAASLLYQDLSLRQFADLDVIVRVKDAVSAVRILETRGYRLEKERSDEALRAYLSTGKDVTLLREDGHVNLEIHWAITTDKDPIRVPPEALWDGLEAVSISGTPVQTFASDRLLLLLCIHGAKHRWEKLGWICDVAEIVRSQPNLDWESRLDYAAMLGGRRILLLGVAMAAELLGAEPPPRVRDAIEADHVLTALREQVKGWLFDGGSASLDLGERERYFIRLRERPTDRCRVALKQAKHYLAPTIRDREALPLPQYLNWSLYLLRPVRLAGEYGLAPVKRFFSGLFQA